MFINLRRSFILMKKNNIVITQFVWGESILIKLDNLTLSFIRSVNDKVDYHTQFVEYKKKSKPIKIFELIGLLEFFKEAEYLQFFSIIFIPDLKIQETISICIQSSEDVITKVDCSDSWRKELGKLSENGRLSRHTVCFHFICFIEKLDFTEKWSGLNNGNSDDIKETEDKRTYFLQIPPLG